MLVIVSAAIPTTEPDQLRAGDSWQWRREDLIDYPASTWTLVYHLRNADQFFDITAAADGDLFAINVPPATTASKVPGQYFWYAMVSDGTDRHQVDNGVVELLADVAQAAVHDGRSWARQMLDKVEAALLNRADKDTLDLLNSTLADEGYSRDREGLIKYRNRLEIEVNRTEHATGGLRRIVARFH